MKFLGLIVALCLVAGTTAFAASITVDGTKTGGEWPAGAMENDDPNNDAADHYDIDENWSTWSDSNDTAYFMLTLVDAGGSANWGNTGDWAAILLDSNEDKTTGGEKFGINGLEYYIEWDLDGAITGGTAYNSDIYQWNGSAWALLANQGVVAWNTGVVEWSVDPDDVDLDDNPGAQIWWGGAMDDGAAGGDDFCPDWGTTPEPATLSIIGLGLAGFALRRRRKKS